ncbi:KDP operon transcriptional regulatory protein KdpE [bioreactor metagenome]|uniref:KDP operon transcriptional regulatory protein KdpE n=1 Tax=bioreactor metagenome TaxID=1076179 RepID=A0A645HA41_9ZZZZ
MEALDLGADDFLAKPFGIDELMARIRVAIRNKERLPMNIPSVFETEGLKIDYVKRRVELDGEELHLTPIEYKILALLTKYEGKVLTHNFIQREVWGTNFYEPQTLRVFMAGLRRKIEKTPAQPHYITTEVGVGYRFNRE